MTDVKRHTGSEKNRRFDAIEAKITLGYLKRLSRSDPRRGRGEGKAIKWPGSAQASTRMNGLRTD